MNSAIERLLTLRVADCMTRPVVVIRAQQTMAEAAEKLARHNISGLAVTDDEGRAVGILSATDFVRREEKASTPDWTMDSVFAPSSKPGASSPPVALPLPVPAEAASPSESLPVAEVAEGLVGNHMTKAVQTVPPEASLLHAARMMCAEHIHRLLVLDAQAQPVGVLTSLDIVAALVAAIDE